MGCRQSKDETINHRPESGGQNGKLLEEERSVRDKSVSLASQSYDQDEENNDNNAAQSTALSTIGEETTGTEEQEPGDEILNLLQKYVDGEKNESPWAEVVSMCRANPSSSQYSHVSSGSLPLHLACSLLHLPANSPTEEEKNGGKVRPADAVRALVRSFPSAVSKLDGHGNLPLHYSIVPTSTASMDDPSRWLERAEVIEILMAADYERATEYLLRTDVVADNRKGTPLYHALYHLPDDFDSHGPTVAFVKILHEAAPSIVTVPNPEDGDRPLALLYRRFSRQFDASEKFFEGDNSRPEIVQHRQKYKVAAMNSWRIIQILLRPVGPDVDSADSFPNSSRNDDFDNEKNKPGAKQLSNDPNTAPTSLVDSVSSSLRRRLQRQEQQAAMDRPYRLVHAAVRIECPPDLLRYIVETKHPQVREMDGRSRLPLHHAASASPSPGAPTFSKYHSKFVIDELLYSYPEGASTIDGSGRLPLVLAVDSDKTWIGGGVKSLYDAYPKALEQLDGNSRHPSLQNVMFFPDDASIANQATQQQGDSSSSVADHSDIGSVGDIVTTASRGQKKIKAEEHHDAIMLVQNSHAPISDVVSAMWANEEDAGVQLLGCMAIHRITAARAAQESTSKAGVGSENAVIAVAMVSMTAIVNAMKNHPNEPAVQEKACVSLLSLGPADGHAEISFAASGAIASIVAAMQAHVGDALVQEHACGALRSCVGHHSNQKTSSSLGAERATVIASVSGWTAIQNAMAAHPTSVKVQMEACRLLEALTFHAPNANLPRLVSGSQAIMASLLQKAAETYPNECGSAAEVVLERLD